VDEVEKARKGFFSDSSSRISPLGGPRTSPLFAMLRPVSLEELGKSCILQNNSEPDLVLKIHNINTFPAYG